MATVNLHTTADTPDQIADMFNNYFTSVFSTCQPEKKESGLEQRPIIQPVINDIVLHVSEVEAVLKSLAPNKAGSPDGIPARILSEGNRHCYRSIIVHVVQQVPGGGLHT